MSKVTVVCSQASEECVTKSRCKHAVPHEPDGCLDVGDCSYLNIGTRCFYLKECIEVNDKPYVSSEIRLVKSEEQRETIRKEAEQKACEYGWKAYVKELGFDAVILIYTSRPLTEDELILTGMNFIEVL